MVVLKFPNVGRKVRVGRTGVAHTKNSLRVFHQRSARGDKLSSRRWSSFSWRSAKRCAVLIERHGCPSVACAVGYGCYLVTSAVSKSKDQFDDTANCSSGLKKAFYYVHDRCPSSSPRRFRPSPVLLYRSPGPFASCLYRIHVYARRTKTNWTTFPDTQVNGKGLAHALHTYE